MVMIRMSKRRRLNMPTFSKPQFRGSGPERWPSMSLWGTGCETLGLSQWGVVPLSAALSVSAPLPV